MTRRKGIPEITESHQIQVSSLCGEHIGMMIRLLDNDEVRGITRVVTAELRQISQNSGEVHLYVGIMAEVEFSFHPEDVVALYPRADHQDVEALVRINSLRCAGRNNAP